MNFEINTNALNGSINYVKSGLEAISKTIEPHGRAEVVTSRRVRLPFERANKRKGITGAVVVGGHHIANFLRSKGRDPFKLPQNQLNEVVNAIEEEIVDAVSDAARTARPQTDRVRRVLIAGAEELARDARRNIELGGLGVNASKYIGSKARFVRRHGLIKHGVPPPYGILSGRFVDGIRHRWRRGYMPGSR